MYNIDKSPPRRMKEQNTQNQRESQARVIARKGREVSRHVAPMSTRRLAGVEGCRVRSQVPATLNSWTFWKCLPYPPSSSVSDPLLIILCVLCFAPVLFLTLPFSVGMITTFKRKPSLLSALLVGKKCK